MIELVSLTLSLSLSLSLFPSDPESEDDWAAGEEDDDEWGSD